MVDARHINAGGGALQGQRYPDILLGNYIGVDERGLPEMLLALRHYAQRIYFYDLADQPTSTWLDLLTNNDTLYIAAEIPFHADEMRRAYRQSCSMGRKASAYFVLRQMDWLHDWLERAMRFRGESAKILRSHVQRDICDHVTSDLSAFFHWVNRAGLSPLSGNQRLDKLRQLLGLASASSNNHRSESVSVIIDQAFFFVLRARFIISVKSKALLNDLLAQEQQGPAAAMLLAFLKVYKKSQDKINVFDQRLLDFYYKDILGSQIKTKSGDLVHLSCTLSETVNRGFIAKGTPFLAAKTDDLKNIIYHTTDDVVVSGARLCALNSVLLQRDSRIAPECFSGSVTRISYDNLLDSRDDDNTMDTHSLFGMSGDGTSSGVGKQARSGIIFTSELLNLKEGHRQISLSFKLEDVGLRKFHEKLCDLYRVYAKQGYSKGLDRGGIKQRSVIRRRFSESLFVVFCQSLTGLNAIKSISNEGDYYHFIKPYIKYLDPLIHAYNPDKPLLPSLKISRIIYRGIMCWMALRQPLTLAQGVALYSRFLELTLFDARFNQFKQCQAVLSRDFGGACAHNTLHSPVSVADNNQLTASHLRGLERLKRELGMSSTSLLVAYFQKGFDVQFTAASGWENVSSYSINALNISHQSKLNHDAEIDYTLASERLKGAPDFDCGFELSLHLTPNDAAVCDADPAVHGKQFTALSPLLLVGVNIDADIFSYSYLKSHALNSVNIAVRVQGLTDFVVQNEYGPVDSSKPFLPFGVIPEDGSNCYISGLEYARKPIDSLAIRCKWKGLPRCHGGFSHHYLTYNDAIDHERFAIELSLASDGNWIPRRAMDKSTNHSSNTVNIHPMFDSDATSKVIKEDKVLYAAIDDDLRTLDKNVDISTFNNIRTRENGLIRLQLKCDENGFGHRLHPLLTSDALAANVKRKPKYKQPLPTTPYTPEINDMCIDYSASESISFINFDRSHQVSMQEQDAVIKAKGRLQAYYLTPHGVENITDYPQFDSGGISFFPRWCEDGNLYIAYDVRAQNETIVIYFRLKNDSVSDSSIKNGQLRWAYYSLYGWKNLENKSVLSDTTDGLMHSGLVTLRVPKDMQRHNNIEPFDKFWFRVSSSAALDVFPSLVKVGFDAFTLRSVDDQLTLSAQAIGIAPEWRPLNDIPTIQSYSQDEPAFARQFREHERAMRQRVFERLRHKNRAVSCWDYERLVLENFPEINLVKCLTATATRYPEGAKALRSAIQPRARDTWSGEVFPNPGCITVVVAPKLAADDDLHTASCRVNPIVLQKITEFLHSRCPMGVNLEVRNATFERIQVRCSLSFSGHFNSDGNLLHRLERDLSNYLSPWSEIGYRGKFDWTIRPVDIEAYLLDLPYVERVFQLAIASVVPTARKFHEFVLKDSVRTPKTIANTDTQLSPVENAENGPISAHFPWSLAVPSKHHFIQVIDSERRINGAREMGVKQMQIGNTFVIKREVQHVP